VLLVRGFIAFIFLLLPFYSAGILRELNYSGRVIHLSQPAMPR